MSSDVQSLLRAAHAAAAGALGSEVRLRRFSYTAQPIRACKGQKVDSGVDSEGTLVTSEQVDFLIAPADYDFEDGAGPVMPERGDQIIEIIDGREIRWETVSPPGGDEKVYRWSDAHRTFLRVHVVAVDEWPEDTPEEMGD